MTGIPVNVSVRPMFMPLFRDDAPRFSVIVAHRRAGKTVASLQRVTTAALKGSTLPNRRYGYIAPLRVQAKNIAWDYLKGFARQIKDATINEAELRADLPNGSRVQLYGADSPDSIRGAYFDGVVLDEVAQMDGRTWPEVVRPMIADRKGWAQFIGTPQGKNAFFDIWEKAGELPGWERYLFRASETGLLDETELAQIRRDMNDENAYAQEMECSWTAAVKGAYYGQIMEQIERLGHFTPIEYNPEFPVTTAWDLGMRDLTAIWFVQPYLGNSWAVLDYFESSMVGVEYYAEEINKRKVWGWHFGQHVGPHDIQDPEWGTGTKRIETARKYGLNFDTCRQHRIYDGIQAVRTRLPRFYFHDKPDCERSARVYRGRLALSLYRQNYNERLGAYSQQPLHDWTSHAADAFRYLCMFDNLNSVRLDLELDDLYDERYNINRGEYYADDDRRTSLGYSRRSGVVG